ncbi:MAG: dienelactone hydrolase family protein [Bacteroidetes bacterium]|nr:dienelactone hydrolase family protein [Bacteroidota bacterium]
MEIISKNIQVTKTARYFLSKENFENVTTVMFVLHGYGMPAAKFLEEFSSLDNNSTLIVAPEGLSRFYTKGFYGNIGASWMTKEDRDFEISDYVNYLDEVYTEVLSKLKQTEKIIILGFSQGGATAARWAASGKSKTDVLIIHSSDIPKDTDFEKLKVKNEFMKIFCLYGNEDKEIRKENFENSVKLLKENEIQFEYNGFNGGHEVSIDSIQKIISD